ncbi:NifU family protein [Mesonia sp. HuA40]|uniref:NifU family protein n=1 Tax=Mesonia sp. HuA40 TaxID=2602761 RepID=UPI0011CC9021|nr:NifU family protein [Mesonia sp. HuA40]TXK73267.1 NifU family protein [Mesonia sp. HuA40]
MENYKIELQNTSNPDILKFETDRFLVNHKSYEFNNIDDAKDSPLAQALFHLPFVKTVYIAQNFVAIKKFNIAPWSEIQNELKSKITDLLNQGTKIVKDKNQNEKIAITVYAESTPNPAVLKFVANKKLVLQSIEFKNIDETKDAPLPQALFHFPFVKEVFLDDNYISITKYDIAEWNEITLELREFIKTYLEEGKPVLNKEIKRTESNKDTEKPKSQADNSKELDSVSKQIIAVLEEYVKPAVASDGGNIMFDSYEANTKTVKVILQGACSGCPSSTITLKNGIENVLKEMLHDKIGRVEAVNG